MSCATTQFPALKFGETCVKPNVVIFLSKHYHLQLDPLFGNGKCETRCIPCAYKACSNMLNEPWTSVVNDTAQLR